MSAANPSHGMKVKHDPASRQNPIREGAGPVTSDSLAAESTRAGGAFAENRDSEPLAVKGANSTFNTTDTSAADELPPARDAAHRTGPEEELAGLGKGDVVGASKGGSGATGENEQRGHGQQQQQQQQQQKQQTRSEDTSAGQQDVKASSGTTAAGKDGGHHHGHDGGEKHHKTAADTTTTHQPEPAPTYVQADVLDRVLHPKPKGRNLTEGGIEDDAPNASFTGEIGTEDDPGRLAELKFETAMARSARDAGYGPKQTKITNDDQYNVLPEEEAP